MDPLSSEPLSPEGIPGEDAEAAAEGRSALGCLEFLSILGDDVSRLPDLVCRQLEKLRDANGETMDLGAASDECTDELAKFAEVMGMVTRYYRRLSQICRHNNKELWEKYFHRMEL